MKKIKGLDKLSKNLKKLESTNTVRLDNLFNSTFMKKYTDFISIYELFEKSQYEVNTEEDLKNIPDLEWDIYINSVTKFNSWKDMQKLAGQEFIKKQMGF